MGAVCNRYCGCVTVTEIARTVAMRGVLLNAVSLNKHTQGPARYTSKNVNMNVRKLGHFQVLSPLGVYFMLKYDVCTYMYVADMRNGNFTNAQIVRFLQQNNLLFMFTFLLAQLAAKPPHYDLFKIQDSYLYFPLFKGTIQNGKKKNLL